MNKHFDIIKLKQFVDGNYPAKMTFEISNHLARCAECREKLQKIAPTFFITPFTEIAEMTAVKNEKHFSDNEIDAFLKAELPIGYRLKMSEHLRKCVDCKSKLYKKDPVILRQTIASILSKEEKFEKKSFFAKFSLPASIGATAVLLIGLLFFILMTNDKSNNPTFEAKINDVNIQTPVVNNSTSVNVVNTAINNSINSNQKAGSNQAGEKNTNKTIEPTKAKISEKPAQTKPVSKSNNIVIANSRSTDTNSNCPPESKITITDRQPTIRWKAIPNVKNYHLYISDNSQILIEESETESKTSYKLKSPLELNKPYKWKVIATTNDEKTFQSESINFSVGKIAKKLRAPKTGSKGINSTRCLP
jgi:hypothetical protein